MDDLEYIKKFSKITLKEVCKKSNVDVSNVFHGKASKKAVNRVRKQIESDVARLYIIEDINEKRESTL